MKLDINMKQIMAYLYATNKFERYDFSFDKRDNWFKVTIYFTDDHYWTIIFNQDDTSQVSVYEWHVSKSWFAPSTRVTYLNKYLKKYRVQKNWHSFAEVPLTTLLKVFQKLPDAKLVSTKDRITWYPTRKGTVLW